MGLLDILAGSRGGASRGGMSPIMTALLGLLAYQAFNNRDQLGNILGQVLGQGGDRNPNQGGQLGDLLGGLLGGNAAARGGQSAGQGGQLGDLLGGLLGGNAAARGQSAGQGGQLGDLLGGLLGGNAAARGGQSAGESDLGDLLGGLLTGQAGGSIVSTGLGDLLKQLQERGQGDKAASWVSNGPNLEVSQADLGHALGRDQIDWLAKLSGMGKDDLLAGLSRELPEVVNKLTPNGRLPTEQELARMI